MLPTLSSLIGLVLRYYAAAVALRNTTRFLVDDELPRHERRLGQATYRKVRTESRAGMLQSCLDQ